MLEGRKIVLQRIEQAGFLDCLTEVRWAKNHSSQTLILLLDENRGVIEDFEDDD
jgi:hypothetical protein